MSSSKAQVVGHIKNHCKDIYVRWEIPNYFLAISQTTNTTVTSPYIYFANATWYLQAEPSGCTDNKNEGWLGLYLIFLNGPEKLSVDFSLGILSNSGEIKLGRYTHVFGSENQGTGCIRFMKRDELCEKRKELVPEGTLTVFWRASLSSQEKNGVSTLSEDIENLFINEKNYDATIKVKDRSFNVHKLILGSRSAVLHAMFEHDIKGNNIGTVNIDDCEPENFHDFLLCLYSEKTENMSPKNAASLYYLADKYLLGSLKQICVDFMKVNLNLDNICEVVTLADRHYEEQLLEIASEWVKNNLKDIIRTDNWINFMDENTLLAAKLLKKAIPA